jgi:8-oxo-dGTP pyrophosphatase MutT (NUDIX family)
MNGPSAHFLTDTAHLDVSDAAAALITLPDGRYVLQHRDDIAGIWYPGHWSLFGGALEADESPEAALRRELSEEIEFDARGLEWFFTQDFDLPSLGVKPFRRSYFLAPATHAQYAAFHLHEGRDIGAFAADEVLGRLAVVPYDAFAIFLHHAQDRIRLGTQPSR